MGMIIILLIKEDGVIVEKKCLVHQDQSFKKFSNKYGDVVANTTLALVDNKEEGQEIDPKAVVQNFQTYQIATTLMKMDIVWLLSQQ